jgi:hypothetical protein
MLMNITTFSLFIFSKLTATDVALLCVAIPQAVVSSTSSSSLMIALETPLVTKDSANRDWQVAEEF